MKQLLILAAALCIAVPLQAQRVMDRLDRGLVPVMTSDGVFLSWRVFGEDPDDLLFNVYRDGALVNQQPLSVSNLKDPAGSTTSSYTVKTVIGGKETSESAPAQTMSANYLEIKMQPLPTADYEPNDATIADLDGDGEMELIIKLRSLYDIRNAYPYNSDQFDVIHAYKMDGTLMWWIHAGPNMVDFQSNELNIAAYDWDGDGRAECVLRGGDGMTIHQADGNVFTVGDPTQNTRDQLGQGGGGHFTRLGNEYLLYIDGLTGKPYQCMTYPLPRFEEGETDLNAAWGDGYGHRSNKHFFGAPYLDGRKPSIFIARGIYTRHKMIAYDVDPASHELIQRWRWNCNNGSSPWFGQGYHNYSIADVDWDGRDEIVFGSMVIDDNGRGLSTTGLGHGDSHHVGDFNPYIRGSEIVACNEASPSNNYRDATTSKIYYRVTATTDDGRAIAGNFTNEFPGAAFITSHDSGSLISCVANAHVPDASPTWDVAQNFRIFWDGDLLDETFNYSDGKNTPGAIYKYKSGVIETFAGTATNNDTKGTPCFQGDIFGDWREEVVLRTADNSAVRIYTTCIPTQYRLYTLLHDPQYRNAMVWQMDGYNQTPHPSFFIGELEGITQAPPAPTMTGREEVGATISGSGKSLIMAATGNASASVAEGAAPAIFIDNAPIWTQGHDNNDNITTETYTHTLTGAGFSGDMKLVKLGGGVLSLPDSRQNYSGQTEIWDGTLAYDGEMAESHVWVGRFATLSTDGGKFPKGVELNYGSALEIGGGDKASSAEMSRLDMNFGSRLKIDLYADGTADQLRASVLKIDRKTWANGPEYSTPVVEFVSHPALGESKVPAGTYTFALLDEIEGSVSDIVIEGLQGVKSIVTFADGRLSLVISDTREATEVVWTGAESSDWESDALNFAIRETGEPTAFVAGDNVIFDDSAAVTSVNIPEAVYPSKITFNNSAKTYTVNGAGIEGECELEKRGTAKVQLNNAGGFRGEIVIANGTMKVNGLGANEGQATGSLGHYSNNVRLIGGGILEIGSTCKTSHPIYVSQGNIKVSGGTLTLAGASITGSGVLVKSGGGQLNLTRACAIDTLKIEGGVVYDEGDTHSLGKCIVFNGTNVELRHMDSRSSYSTDNANFIVPEGKSGRLTLDGRCAYKGKLSGKGKLTVTSSFVRNTLEGDWSEFEGNLVAVQGSGSNFDFYSAKGLPKATLTVSAGCLFKNTDSQSGGARNDNMHIGALEGEGDLGGKGTYNIGDLGKNTSFGGSFVDNVNIVKIGSGNLTICKEQTKISKLTIEEGAVVLDDPQQKITKTMTGGKSLEVTGQLLGCGIAGNSTVTFKSGSQLKPTTSQKTLRFRTITFTQNVVMEPGAIFTVEIQEANKYGNIKVDGKLSQSGTVKVELKGYAPAVGDEFILWTAAEGEGMPAFELPQLAEGFAWDISAATPEMGLLKVVESNSVDLIPDDVMVDCHVMTLDGKVIAAFRSAKADALQTVREMGPGIYMVHLNASGIQAGITIAQ